ncbi:hypothetical protein BH11BAC5_BH11BAC5_20660 [soil metagenome]
MTEISSMVINRVEVLNIFNKLIKPIAIKTVKMKKINKRVLNGIKNVGFPPVKK